MSPAALSEFAAAFFPAEMAKRQIPGAVFVVVVDGEAALARGYGVADVARQRPVNPARTRFRLASVSKVITATAALKLVEAGRLRLHQDVNEVLQSLRIPPRAGAGAVTLHHLLTHTAGFEERLTGLMARRASDLEPLETYLARTLPPRFADPGQVISYSNHGLALVGLLVQEASGRPFDRYVRERVFEPLEMSRSGALTGDPPDDMAVAYDLTNGRLRALAPEYLQTGPAGMFYSTGADMARFLLAHLNGGSWSGRRILEADTMALMHAPQARAHPALSGWAYGFWEDRRQAPRALLHDGGGQGYRALLYLVPDAGVGFFTAYNLADRHADGELQDALIRRFRHAFLPAPPEPASPAQPALRTPEFGGDYRYVRRARHGVESLIGVLNTVRVVVDDSGSLVLIGRTPGPVVLHHDGERLFRRADGRGLVAFGDLRDGRAHQLVLGDGFPGVYERVSPLATLRVQAWWLAATCAVMLYVGLGPLVSRLARRSPSASSTDGPTRLDRTAAVLNLLLVVLLPLTWFGRLEGGLPEFVFGLPPTAHTLLYVSPLTAVLAAVSAARTGRAWLATPRRPPLRRLVTSAALVSFSLFAAYWNVMPG